MCAKRRILLTLALLATAAWIFFIWERSAQNAEESMEESGWVMKLVENLLPGISAHLVRKLAHVTEFLILGGLLWTDCRLLGKERTLFTLCVGLAVAGADEFHQTFVPGRSGQLSDVLIDFFGVVLSVLLLGLLSSRSKLRMQRQIESTKKPLE